MTYTTTSAGPFEYTQRIIRYLILATCIISIFCAFVNVFFESILQMHGPQHLLSLSWAGLAQGYIWQPLTYLLVQSNGLYGISISFLLELAFNMYILWIIGSSIVERSGSRSFIYFYMSAGIIIGFFTLQAMLFLGRETILAGPSGPLLAMLMVWAMAHPESDVQMFYLFSVKAKWLAIAIVAFITLSHLSHLNFVYVAFTLFSCIYGYLYGALVWQLESPFTFMRPLDRFLVRQGSRIRSALTSKKGANFTENKKKKIIDFQTGKTLLDDDHFMDSALEKISKYGEKSLTWNERHRMKTISERKTRNKE